MYLWCASAGEKNTVRESLAEQDHWDGQSRGFERCQKSTQLARLLLLEEGYHQASWCVWRTAVTAAAGQQQGPLVAGCTAVTASHASQLHMQDAAGVPCGS
jgi:hypothetical protein